MSEESTQRCISTLVIQPGGGTNSGTTSVATTQGGSSEITQKTSQQMSSSFASSSTSSSSKSVTSSKTTKTTKTTSQTSSKTTKSFTSFSSSSSRSVAVKSSQTSFSDFFGKQSGIDVDAEMKKLMSGADDEIESIRRKFFNFQPLSIMSGDKSELVKIDSDSLSDYIDKNQNDRLKFNFDVHEFESESISVQSDGNKIQIHAKKKSKKGDGDEQIEEYSRVYEMPTSGTLNPEKVVSSVFKDGVLTIELPVSEAIESK